MSDVSDDRPKTSNRDYDVLHDDLERWLGTTAVPGSDPTLSELHVPEKNGMSSETVLFDVTTAEDGTRGHRPGCKAGAVVVLSEGDLALYVERGGRSVLSFVDGPRLVEACTALADAVRSGRLGKVVVQRIDGVDALAGVGTASTPADEAARALVEAGFRPTPRGLRAA